MKTNCFTISIYLQATNLLQGLIPVEDERQGSTISREHFAKLFVFTMMWSVGAFLEISDRIKLEEYMRNNDEFTVDMPVIPEGSDDTMFDFFVDAAGMCVVLTIQCGP